MHNDPERQISPCQGGQEEEVYHEKIKFWAPSRIFAETDRRLAAVESQHGSPIRRRGLKRLAFRTISGEINNIVILVQEVWSKADVTHHTRRNAE